MKWEFIIIIGNAKLFKQGSYESPPRMIINNKSITTIVLKIKK